MKRLARREVGRVSERIRMILLSSRGYTVPQIAEIFECDEATVRNWIERFEAEGVEGLRDRPRPGRPRHEASVRRQFPQKGRRKLVVGCISPTSAVISKKR